MYELSTAQDTMDIARGAVFLGTGGGGDPYVGELFLRAQLDRNRRATIVDLSELADDAFVLSIAGIGSPPVLVEHLVSERTLMKLLARAEAYWGRKVDALISAEIGGANSVFPLAISSISGTPVIDGDGIGRAAPRVEMTTFSIFGCKATPAILVDDAGNEVVVTALNDRIAEDICRTTASALGAIIFGALYPMTGAQAKACAVPNTLTQALEIGRRIRRAREHSDDVAGDLIGYLRSQGRAAGVLFDGKISDVVHETRDGWHCGQATLVGGGESGQTVTLDIQNEYISLRRGGRPLVLPPDMIAVVDRQSGEPLTAEMLCYGQRVKVIGMSAHPLLRRPESLKVIGPGNFGLDDDFTPIEQLSDLVAY